MFDGVMLRPRAMSVARQRISVRSISSASTPTSIPASTWTWAGGRLGRVGPSSSHAGALHDPSVTPSTSARSKPGPRASTTALTLRVARPTAAPAARTSAADPRPRPTSSTRANPARTGTSGTVVTAPADADGVCVATTSAASSPSSRKAADAPGPATTTASSPSAVSLRTPTARTGREWGGCGARSLPSIPAMSSTTDQLDMVGWRSPRCACPGGR